AVTLIARYGIEKATYIIDFSSRAAPETKYKPQTFGGILHYASRALAEYEMRKLQREQFEKLQIQEEQRQRIERERAHADREAEATAEAYLNALSAGERQTLYDQLLAEARATYAHLTHWDEEAIRLFMRRLMIRHVRRILEEQNG